MFLKIVQQPAFQITGHAVKQSFAQDRTFELWSGFMPVRHQVCADADAPLVSLQRYPTNFSFAPPDLETSFEKWAGCITPDGFQAADGFETLHIPSGTYAVFLHRGPASGAARTFGYIFSQWLPDSGYEIDVRPHFEILDKRYKHNQPDSEEEVFIPIKLRLNNP